LRGTGIQAFIEADAAGALGFLDEFARGFVAAFARHDGTGCEREAQGILLIVEIKNYLPGRHTRLPEWSRWRAEESLFTF
jgi:hypothetical protein